MEYDAPTPRPHGELAQDSRPAKTRAARPEIHFLAGAVGGLATSSFTSPLDVLRTRLQSDFYQKPPPKNTMPLDAGTTLARILTGPSRHIQDTLRIFYTIHHAEGWRGLFRGLGPSLTGVVPASAVKFYVYGNCKTFCAQLSNYSENSSIVHAQAAVAAGLATATVTNPIWLIKTRLQLDVRQAAAGTTRQYEDSLDCIRQVLRQEGISGLYRGLSASYLGTVETALHLVLYEQFKLFYRRIMARPGIPESGGIKDWVGTSGAAGSAKLAAVLRTRLRQAPIENGARKYTGLWQCFQRVRVEEGIAGLYGGLTPHLMRSIPAAIITLGVYEFVIGLV
ncbi:hypothetical protein JX265_009807 [Neoarthrinium moseri]|uniref:Mitochondrial carrier protein n=1 Tax=Neoarthrinium moseri TaxID=1658444 RepID=A0A9P9WF72_9PEZI|nr:hypothetical protein JX265_009807 [Neoarthrinium moseri]